MSALNPEKLANIVTVLSTLHRAGALEASDESTIAGRNVMAAAFVVGGSILMHKRAVEDISNELRDLMQSNDSRLNELHNALLDLIRSIEHGVRLLDSNAEAFQMKLSVIAEQLGDAVPELAGAIEGVGTDIGAGLAEGLQAACKRRQCRHNG